MNKASYIPFNLPDIGDEEIHEVVETLRSGWLTTGPRTARLEELFRAYTGCRHTLALSSGTAALHLALASLGIGPGDEVITTPITFCSTVSAIIHVGATPVLADIRADGNIDPVSIYARMSSRTRAVIPVHLGGMPCDLEAIWGIAIERGIHVVEDAAHAAGMLYRGCHVGSAESQSDAVAFSFYATKNITTAEGGMVTTNSESLAARMRCLSLHGLSTDAWDRYRENGSWQYRVLEPGYKYNLSDIHAAIGIHQLGKLERFIERRSAYAKMYSELLADVCEVETPVEPRDGRSAWHLYILRLNLDKLDIDRDRFIEELRLRNIGTSVHFIPIQLHAFFGRWAREMRNQCPGAIQFYKRIISLPLYPSMRPEQIQTVVSAVKAIVRSARKTTQLATSAAQ
jgi:dTDP-4-amino-4,6-dideoxygalactose transaminase